MKELTKVEEEVMQVIWNRKKGLVRDFIEDLPDPKPPYSTISSVVRILEKKGFVNHKAYGKTHEYFPVIAKDDYRKFVLNSLAERFFSGSPRALMSFFAREEKLGLKDMSEIISEIKKAEDND